MKYWITFLFLFLLIQPRAFSFESCDNVAGQSFDVIQNLANDVFEATASMSQTQKVLGVTITKFYKNQGSGSVSVITDEKGNIAGVRVDFLIDGKKETMVKTFGELKNGEALDYIKGNEKKPALVVKKSSSGTIYPDTGGEFTFSLLTKKPGTYQHHSLYLRKENGTWIVKNKNGAILSTVDLIPNLSLMEWNGTFSEASFK